MAVSVTLPALGESVTEGTVTRWLKQIGDTVAADEPLLEISTDKVDTEIPSPAAGILLEIKVGEDETVEVGAELAVIGQEGESAGDGGGVAEVARPEPSAQSEPAAQPEAPQPVAPPVLAPAVANAGASTGAGTPVTLPALGESVTEGTVTRWLKQVGDTVAVDEPLLEISTDKVDTEIPSPAAGILLEIKVAEDETVEVGAELALIGQEGAVFTAAPPGGEAPGATPAPAAAPAPPAPAPPAPARPAPAPPAQAPSRPAPGGAQGDGAAYVTPLVRRLATEHNVNLSSLKGTGVGGRIRKQDVLAAADAAKSQAEAEAAKAAPAPTPAAAPAPAATTTRPAAAPAAPSPLRGTTQKMSRRRQTIARRMVESLQVSAQLTTVVEVDVTAIAALRARAKGDFERREGVKLSFLPFFAKAALEALKVYPQLNATINTETSEVAYFDAEHLGVAVDTESGLVVPVIRDAGDLNIAGLARKIADVAERTRTNKIAPDELSGGTFTLTNTGSRGALFDTPIINQPQVGILGTGTVVKRPVVVSDQFGTDSIAIRSMIFLALTYDHRLVDGADAARFLGVVKQRLEEGNFDGDL